VARAYSLKQPGGLTLSFVMHLVNVCNNLTDHRLHGSASPVLTANGFVNAKGQFLTYYGIDTPQPMTQKNKNVTGDYVGDPYDCAILSANLSTGASGHIGEI